MHPIFFGLKGAKHQWSEVDANALLAIEGCFENNRRSKTAIEGFSAL